MCGICGIIWLDKDRPADEAGVRRMMSCLERRGPDDSGVFLGAGGKRVALGHRRLSIIDLETGAQPMTSDSGLAIVYNGEIFNYRELKAEFEARGKTFRTKSDTEVILKVFEDERERTPASLDGQFAFAVWDERDGTLFLSRDRLGEKPLFYTAMPDRFVFASSLESLVAAGGIPREIDPESLDLYLTWGYIPAPRTIFKGVAKLPPASTLAWKDGAVAIRRYWSAEAHSEKSMSEAALREELRERMTQAVRSRLVADVPLGAFLSGGIDSSLIVALMAEDTKEPVRTFCIGFDDPRYDERTFAAAAAMRAGAIHREFIVAPKAADVLPDLVRAFGEPFADSSAVPTWYLSRETRAHVKVSLSGDGGDELFGGYDRYRAMRLAAWLDRRPKFVRKALSGLAARMAAGSGEQRSKKRRAERFLAALETDAVGRYVAWMSLFDAPARSGLLTEDFAKSLGDFRGESFLRNAFARHSAGSPAAQAMAVDIETYLPGDLLVKTDVASMGHGIEVRCPFLDHRLVEFASWVPESMKLSARTGKRLLRSAFRDELPGEIRRRKKMGFGVPLANWFRGELKPMLEDTLFAQDAATRNILRPDALRSLVDEHQSGRSDHGQRLWALLFLELWWRQIPR